MRIAVSKRALRAAMGALLCLCTVVPHAIPQALPLPAASAAAPPRSATNNLLVVVENDVQVARAGTGAWTPAQLGQILFPGDRVRTGERSRAEVYLTNTMTIKLSELDEMEVPPSGNTTFRQGRFRIFEKDKQKQFRFGLPSGTGSVRGTEFLVIVAENGRSEVIVLNGEVLLSNAGGEVYLTNGMAGVLQDQNAPPQARLVVTPVNDLIQWTLDYPAVVDVRELALTAEERQSLGASLAAYRSGDLLHALAEYPWEQAAVSEDGRVYRAALLLAVGQVEEAQGLLGPRSGTRPGLALRQLIAAVKFEPWTPASWPSSASEWLAESYYQQSRTDLNAALRAATNAAAISPRFGFAWARVAELEFSFGYSAQALEHLQTAIALSPRNAAAVALKGFLLAARNDLEGAIDAFEQAISIDSGLGNAWLGRGLSLIHRGNWAGGQRDLLVAAALEPQRAVYRSYLGKAFGDPGDTARAREELALAQAIDPNDPTAWLYSALLNQQADRINEGIRDLERSQELNENRSLFRSRLLLDQDQAVRSANLAALYRDAGMFEVSVREASEAVNTDYANYSAHLFLANSYDQLRDPNLVSLRFETAAVSEYLIANLLAPVGAGPLSPAISAQEYSKFFEQDHLGVASSVDYQSSGSYGGFLSQYGVEGNVSYELTGFYRFLNGPVPNAELRQKGVSGQFKYQLTPQDSLYLQAVYSDLDSGDVRQHYDPSAASPNLQISERQEPNVFAGLHHQWTPGVHTLFLGARLNDTFTLRDRATLETLLVAPNGAVLMPFLQGPFDLDFRSEFNAYSIEFQQIMEKPDQGLVFGGRFQTGDTLSEAAALAAGPGLGALYPADTQRFRTDLQRINFYLYHYWRLSKLLSFTTGLSYDRLFYPENAGLPPISDDQTSRDQLSPKAGFRLQLSDSTILRAAYTRSLGGLFFDSSIRLEPTQVAGFNQAFRSLIPESVQGSIAGSTFETVGIGLDQRFASDTYLTFEAELLKSRAERTVGVFQTPIPLAITRSETSEKLDFAERSLGFTINQLIGRDWALGSRYRLSEAELESRFPEVPQPGRSLDRETRALLHQVNLFAIYNHPCGFFGQAQSLWTAQRNHGDDSTLANDSFWHFNVFVGYRFARRRAELALGLLNLTDQDYRLNPLNLHAELPRDRTFIVSLRLHY